LRLQADLNSVEGIFNDFADDAGDLATDFVEYTCSNEDVGALTEPNTMSFSASNP
jgi:hypothetical protein